MKITYLILIAFAFSLVSIPSLVSAVSCGEVIRSDTSLTEDLSCSYDGLYLDYSGITLDCNGYTIRGSGLGSYDGVQIRGSFITVKNCNIKNFLFGIFIGPRLIGPRLNVNYSRIISNNLTNNTFGIGGEDTFNALIDDNNVSFNNLFGIALANSQYTQITNNNITNNSLHNSGSGIFLTGDLSRGSAHNNIANNVIIKNKYGLILEQTEYISIVNNSIKDNLIGIVLRYRNLQDNITRNNISNNINYGIYIAIFNSGSSWNSTIYDNYFSNNLVIDEVGQARWNIGKTRGKNIVNGPFISGNFWADYTGEDTNDDGIGDTNLPYNSNGNIIDSGINNGGDILPLVHFKMPTICIDPGHGGSDSGSIGIDNITKEKDVNLNMANTLRNILIIKGFNIIMTREDDSNPSHPDRVSICDNGKASIMVSIHNNWESTQTSRGTSALYFDATDEDNVAFFGKPSDGFSDDIAIENPEINTYRYKLGSNILKNVMETAKTNQYNIGTIADWPFYLEDGRHYHLGLLGYAYMLDNKGDKLPTVIVETAFMSNQDDLNLINNYLFKEAVATGIYNGLVDYFGYPDKRMLDSDKDGVINSQDKCPYDSSQGYDSNKDGCKDLIPPSTIQPSQPKKIIKRV